MLASVRFFGSAIVIAALLMVVGPATATASSGQISQATANESWTQGSFAFSATWTDCGSGPCNWLPVATVQPALPEYGCQGDEALDSDPNTKLVWSGGQRTSNDTASASLNNVPILSGVHGQRVCLSVIETRQIRDPVCVAQAPVFGDDPNTCPFVDRIFNHVLASRLLEVSQPADGSTTPPPTGSTGGSTTPPPTGSTDGSTTPPPTGVDSQACEDAQDVLETKKKKAQEGEEERQDGQDQEGQEAEEEGEAGS
jgi:hypothetical protein